MVLRISDCSSVAESTVNSSYSAAAIIYNNTIQTFIFQFGTIKNIYHIKQLYVTHIFT